MRRGKRLTISARRGRPGQAWPLALPGFALVCVILAGLALAGCAVEIGPPPESDPPLVSQAAKEPPPQQPSEPQPWAQGLDFDSAPAATAREELVKGLVPAEEPVRYSGQLTYEAAFNPEKPPSEAELTRQRARERAAQAGLPPPPQVTAAPVTQVEAQTLPPAGASGEAQPAQRQSRLPPPPKFPPVGEEWQETAAVPTPAADAGDGQGDGQAGGAQPAPEPWSARNSRLPAPPAFPPGAKAEPKLDAEEDSAPVAVTAAAPAPADTAGETMSLAAEAWQAPAGTILVQVSAVSASDQVAPEWERLQARYPQVLRPLRLVVEEARLEGRGVFFRVQAGAFPSQEGAAAACQNLIGQGQACFVVVR